MIPHGIFWSQSIRKASPQLLPQHLPRCLLPDFDIMAILHTFPKDTACGPSGLRIQHLIEAAEVPLQFPIGAVLRDVVNLSLARFLCRWLDSSQGVTWWPWKKTNPTPPPPPPPRDIRPIAAGEAIRLMAGKCLCLITKAPLQLGPGVA